MTRRDKLSVYIDILKVLAASGPMRITHISQRVNVNASVLKEYLEFCRMQKLVEKKEKGKRVLYEASPRGVEVLKFFGEIRGVIQSVEKKQTIPPIAYGLRRKGGSDEEL